ncbi:MAG TPA: high-affinity nickel-transport family protein [Methylomirabilota bacterium]|jgi:high-affinity nickel-transport protein|nr:high-affinity nickel-transport family protein [Methylomirabilota bacterium]
MDWNLPVVLLGLLFGIQHATDPDHVLAVATIVSRTRRFGAGALIGVFWGLGHSATVTAVGLAIIGLNLTITPVMGLSMELAVALMLMALGAARIAWVFRGSDPVPAAHLTEPHPHEVAAGFHCHPHAHAGSVHRHPHVHPPRGLMLALQTVGPAQAFRSLCVGLVHGLAGSAAVALLVLTTIRSAWGAVGYLLLFGVGTMAGMTAITALLSLPFATRIPLLQRWRRGFALGTGALSLAFGLYLAFDIGFAQGLFLGHPIWAPR